MMLDLQGRLPDPPDGDPNCFWCVIVGLSLVGGVLAWLVVTL